MELQSRAITNCYVTEISFGWFSLGQYFFSLKQIQRDYYYVYAYHTMALRWVTMALRWVTMALRWVTMALRWVTMALRWVNYTNSMDTNRYKMMF